MSRLILRLFLIAPLVFAGLARAQSREERDIRALLDRGFQAASSVDPKVARQLLSEYGSGAGPFFPLYGPALSSVSDVESQMTQTLGQLSARTVSPTGPINVKADRNTGWATFSWKADLTYKDGTRTSSEGRSTVTFVRERKKWKFAHWHHSIPAPAPLTGSALQAEGDAVLKVERDAWEAAKNKEIDALSDYFTEDASMFSDSEAYRLRGKADLMRSMETWINRSDLHSYQMLDPQVQVVGNTALLTYYFSLAGTRSGKDFSQSGKITMVFVKQDGKWRALHEHVSAAR